MNPEKLRDTYGKLIYLLQDSQIPEVKELLEFDCVKPIVTVYSVLEENNALDLLKDPLIIHATKEITPPPPTSALNPLQSKSIRRQVQTEIKRKESAIESLSRKFATSSFAIEMVRQCIYSIGDNHAFLRTNR